MRRRLLIILLTMSGGWALSACGGGGLRVVDSQGQDMGSVISALPLGVPAGFAQPGQTWVAREISGTWISFGVTVDGFFQPSGDLFYHQNANCMGQRFMRSQPNPLFRVAVVSGSTAFYPGNPIQMQSFGSTETFQPGADLNNPGTCVPPPAPMQFGPFDSGPATTVTIPAFSPPLTLAK